MRGSSVRALAQGAAFAAILCVAACEGEPGKTSDAGVPGSTRTLTDASQPQPPLEVLAEREDSPERIAIDERNVYWTSPLGVRRAPLTGGAASTLVSSSSVRGLATAPPAVVFGEARAGTVSRVGRDDAVVRVLGTGSWPATIAIRDGAAYWANSGMTTGAVAADGNIATAPLDGGAMRVLASGLSQPSGVAVDADFVYFTSTSQGCSGSSPPTDGGVPSGGGAQCWGGGVWKLPLAGGEPRAVDTKGTPTDVVVGPQGVYWMTSPGPRVMFAPHPAGPARVLATVVGEDIGPIALDADAFYFSSSFKGRVVKVPLGGGAPVALVTDLGTTGGIAVDADWVYVAATQQGRILRVAKDGSAAEPAGDIAGPCPTPLGSASEIAMTPRANPNLELLALHVDSGSIVAAQATYNSVVADVAAIRKLQPQLADIDYLPPHDGRSLMLSLSDMTARSVQAGDYSAWDCLNEFYGLQSQMYQPSTLVQPWVELVFKGLYDIGALGALYRELPGIQNVQATVAGGDGSTICARRAGSEIEYVFDRASGDCFAGCIDHDAQRFRSTAAGTVEALEDWSSQGGSPAPEWFTRVCTR